MAVLGHKRWFTSLSEDHFFYQTETIRSDRTGTGEKYGKKKKR